MGFNFYFHLFWVWGPFKIEGLPDTNRDSSPCRQHRGGAPSWPPKLGIILSWGKTQGNLKVGRAPKPDSKPLASPGPPPTSFGFAEGRLEGPPALRAGKSGPSGPLFQNIKIYSTMHPFKAPYHASKAPTADRSSGFAPPLVSRTATRPLGKCLLGCISGAY